MESYGEVYIGNTIGFNMMLTKIIETNPDIAIDFCNAVDIDFHDCMCMIGLAFTYWHKPKMRARAILDHINRIKMSWTRIKKGLSHINCIDEIDEIEKTILPHVSSRNILKPPQDTNSFTKKNKTKPTIKKDDSKKFGAFTVLMEFTEIP